MGSTIKNLNAQPSERSIRWLKTRVQSTRRYGVFTNGDGTTAHTTPSRDMNLDKLQRELLHVDGDAEIKIKIQRINEVN